MTELNLNNLASVNTESAARLPTQLTTLPTQLTTLPPAQSITLLLAQSTALPPAQSTVLPLAQSRALLPTQSRTLLLAWSIALSLAPSAALSPAQSTALPLAQSRILPPTQSTAVRRPRDNNNDVLPLAVRQRHLSINSDASFQHEYRFIASRSLLTRSSIPRAFNNPLNAIHRVKRLDLGPMTSQCPYCDALHWPTK